MDPRTPAVVGVKNVGIFRYLFVVSGSVNAKYFVTKNLFEFRLSIICFSDRVCLKLRFSFLIDSTSGEF